MANIFDIPLETLGGKPTKLDGYRGKVLLVVNVASKCGFTPQYTGLETLFKHYAERGLVVLGFPANDFAGQEPGSNEEIASFCSTEYPVSFPLFSKISVVGPAKHPLYASLIAEQPQRLSNNNELHQHLSEYAAEHGFPPPNELPEVLWNFEKFLVNREGKVVARFNSDIKPDDPKLIEAVETALA